MSFLRNLVTRWRYFWTKRAGWSGLSRVAGYMAALGTKPYHARATLAYASPRGYVALSAVVVHRALRIGRHVYIGDGCYLFQSFEGGPIDLADRVEIYGETTLQTGRGGSIRIGEHTHIQPRCQLSAHVGSIEIGARVEIAPQCAFYAYNHGIVPDIDIMSQPLTSRGGIRVGEGAWLGHGVIVLDGVEIGAGAVVAAGSVVNRSIPANAIAAGSPARVVRQRGEAR